MTWQPASVAGWYSLWIARTHALASTLHPHSRKRTEERLNEIRPIFLPRESWALNSGLDWQVALQAVYLNRWGTAPDSFFSLATCYLSLSFVPALSLSLATIMFSLLTFSLWHTLATQRAWFLCLSSLTYESKLRDCHHLPCWLTVLLGRSDPGPPFRVSTTSLPHNRPHFPAQTLAFKPIWVQCPEASHSHSHLPAVPLPVLSLFKMQPQTLWCLKWAARIWRHRGATGSKFSALSLPPSNHGTLGR